MDKELLTGSGSGTLKIQSWIWAPDLKTLLLKSIYPYLQPGVHLDLLAELGSLDLNEGSSHSLAHDKEMR